MGIGAEVSFPAAGPEPACLETPGQVTRGNVGPVVHLSFLEVLGIDVQEFAWIKLATASQKELARLLDRGSWDRTCSRLTDMAPEPLIWFLAPGNQSLWIPEQALEASHLAMVCAESPEVLSWLVPWAGGLGLWLWTGGLALALAGLDWRTCIGLG